MLTPEQIVEFRKQGAAFRQQVWESNPENKKRLDSTRQWRERQRRQGRIFNHNIKHWLDIEIATARAILAIGILLTAPIKGQFMIWIIMYLAYKTRVKKVTQEAIATDRKKDKI